MIFVFCIIKNIFKPVLFIIYIKMGLFKRNQKENMEIPQLPELPDLPKLPEINDNPTNRLPLYPNSFNQKFSQNLIKEAVSGKEEGDEEAWEADEFVREQEMRMMQQPPLKKPMIERYDESKEQEIPSEFRHIAKQMKKTEPLFIRIDKFEESADSFEKIREKIFEIDKLLKDVKKIKEDEEKELNLWEEKVQTMKRQMEKIDKDLFSKIE